MQKPSIEDKMLTLRMKEALVAVGFGVRKYSDGYRSIETMERVDGRSLEALFRRGLVTWDSTGGNPQVIRLHLTKEGEELFEELRYEEAHVKKSFR